MNKKWLLVFEGIKRLVEKEHTAQGEVVAVDETAFTCDVKLPNEMFLYDVQLKPLKEAKEGVTLIPEIGSTVELISLGSPNWLVLSADNISKILWSVDGTTLEVKKDLFQINEGKNGGIPIAANVVERLNELESDLNALKGIFNKWVPSTEGALQLALTTPQPGVPKPWITPINKTIVGDIENDKVKH